MMAALSESLVHLTQLQVLRYVDYTELIMSSITWITLYLSMEIGFDLFTSEH